MTDKIISATKPFHRVRTWTGERETTGEEYTMGFAEFKEADAPLGSKERMVAFETDVIDELQGAGRGDMVELELQLGDKDNDPVILDAQVVKD